MPAGRVRVQIGEGAIQIQLKILIAARSVCASRDRHAIAARTRCERKQEQACRDLTC